MKQHTLELSQSLIPDFGVGTQESLGRSELSVFELSMLCGSMVHPMSTFSISSDGTSFSTEWVQKYPI